MSSSPKHTNSSSQLKQKESTNKVAATSPIPEPIQVIFFRSMPPTMSSPINQEGTKR